MTARIEGAFARLTINGNEVTLPLLALRDRCECAACSHPSGQRLLDPAALPVDLSAEILGTDGDVLRVRWSPEGHESTYRLADLLPAGATAVVDGRGSTRDDTCWDAEAALQLPIAAHSDVTAAGSDGDHALLHWLQGVARMGCGVLTGVPTEDGEVARVAELFGFVRETNYGRWFDVRTQVDPTNLANTSLGLPPHTDNPYRDPVPTMQLLHCHQSSAAGGENVLVDGFRVAQAVRDADSEGFAALVARAVTFEYHDATASLTTTAPLIELDADGAVRSVRFNHRSLRQLPVPATPAEADALAAWYRAYTMFARLVADPRFHIHVRLAPGDLFIVDNRRVLHGRTAYEAGGGSRHLQGCYADIDGLHSTIRVLQLREIVDLFAQHGDQAYLGERVSMSEHMLQAAHTAQQAGAAESVVVAALLHDVGHLVHDQPAAVGPSADGLEQVDRVHEDVGARWLQRGFGPAVTEPVRLHVAAKRYLCAVEPDYFAALSPASVHTLQLQGGPMSTHEAAAFAALPHADAAVQLRRFDDAGKRPGDVTPGLDHFLPLVERQLRRA